MEQHEQAFAVEAQEEVLLARNRSRERHTEDGKIPAVVDAAGDDVQVTEESPLIGSRRRVPYSRAGASYQRALDQPWTGAHGVGLLPWYKQPSIFWLLPAFLPFCLAFGGIIVPKQYLVLDLICKDYLSDRAAKDPDFESLPVVFGGKNPQCQNADVQSLVAMFNLYMALIGGILSAIVAPQFGALSDRVGRKKVMVLTSIGGFSMEIITIIVGRGAGQVSVYWILLGSALDGLCGSFTTGMALSFAYATDCTQPERRNTAFGYFHGTLFSGIAFGPILAAVFIKLTGSILVPFYVALGCHVFFICFVAFLIPESLSKERQMQAREKHRLVQDASASKSWTTKIREYNLFQPLWVLRPQGPGSSPDLRRNLFLLASIDTLMFGVAMSTMGLILIYAKHMFGWDEIQASQFLSVVNICRVAGLIIVLPLLTRVFRGPTSIHSKGHKGSDLLDVSIIRGAIIFDLIGYLGYALASSAPVLVVSGMIASLGGIGSPTLQSSLTKHIPANRTGQVLGASGLLHALSRVVAPVIFNLIYSRTVKNNARIVFFCLASIFIVVVIMSWFVKTNVYFDESAEFADDEDDTNEASPRA